MTTTIEVNIRQLFNKAKITGQDKGTIKGWVAFAPPRFFYIMLEGLCNWASEASPSLLKSRYPTSTDIYMYTVQENAWHPPEG